MKLVLGQIPGQKKYLLNCIPAPTPDHAARWRLRRLRLAHVLLRVHEVDLANLVLLAAGGVDRRRRGDGGQLRRGARRIFGVLGDEFLLCLTTAVARGRGHREGN